MIDSIRLVTDRVLESVFKLRLRRFSGSFKPIFDSNCRGNINPRILPLQFESKIGQNNPENRQRLKLTTLS